MASITLDVRLLAVFFWFFSLFCSATADHCDDGTYCDAYCCDDGFGGSYCCYSVAFAWWFWFIWGFFLLIILISCCAVMRRRRMMRQQQIIVVQQDYPTATSYGTLTNAQAPPAYIQPAYTPYGYPQPSPGPAPQYQPVESAQPLQQAQPFQQGQVLHNPNEKPPPYNPNAI